MSLSERIKEVRNKEKLTQVQFGARIGLKQNTIALIEGGRPTSDQTIYAICRTFNVSETWLRTGEGEMYESKGPDTLGDYLKERGVTELEEEIIRAWMELPPKERRELLAHFQHRLANHGVIPAASSTAAEHEETPEERHERHKREARAEADELYEVILKEKMEQDDPETTFGSNSYGGGVA
ncbi:MAG: helix-turn-helix domain-containing protein [Oscillibacter sp.]|nr:helix-turn-helix domain-containing protein [Oscillibacter sp.]